MYIGIDGNEANVNYKVGVNYYSFELLRALYKLNNRSYVKDKYVIYLKTSPLAGMPAENDYWRYKLLPGKGVWILTKLMPHLAKGERPDIFFSPSHYLPLFSRVPMVCTIHDLGYLKFSEQFKKKDFWQLKIWTAISIIVSKYIISVSKSTMNDIVRHYPFASNKIKVVYHGYDSSRYNNNIDNMFVRHAINKYGINKKYLLFIGTLKPSKNIEGLLKAFSIVKEHFSDYRIVIVGKKGWLFDDIFQYVKKLNLEKDVIFTGYIKEEDKRAIISGASLFVLPSYWEGFGMDILNAMACGVPVVASNVASIPEVLGEAGIYIDPYNTESIANGIMKVINMNGKEYNKVVEKGLIQAQNFSWLKSAETTLNILRKAAK